MHPRDCPSWEYSDFINSTSILTEEVRNILLNLRKKEIDPIENSVNTKQIHNQMFRKLTPTGYPYYAGHYRGENYRCLKYHRVTIRSDRRVGYPPHQVIGYMTELDKIIRTSIKALDQGMNIPNVQMALKEKISYLVAVACRIFEYFLRIHPYVNGNGHTARFCIWAILGRYDIWPQKWSIDPRPPDPPYTDLIVEYRNGNPQPLEEYIMQTLISD